MTNQCTKRILSVTFAAFLALVSVTTGQTTQPTEPRYGELSPQEYYRRMDEMNRRAATRPTHNTTSGDSPDVVAAIRAGKIAALRAGLKLAEQRDEMARRSLVAQGYSPEQAAAVVVRNKNPHEVQREIEMAGELAGLEYLAGAAREQAKAAEDREAAQFWQKWSEGNPDVPLIVARQIWLEELSRISKRGYPNDAALRGAATEAFERRIAEYRDAVAKGAIRQEPRKEENRKEMSSGTAWVCAQGYVITNHHVIADATTIVLLGKDGAKFAARPIADDPTNDLAVLQVDDPAKLPAGLPLSAAQPAPGERVFTLGFPQPDVMGINVKLTEGIVNATSGLGDDVHILQISVPIQSGNSGGPLINMKGEVVGIVTSTLNPLLVLQLGGTLPQNVNYAVKVTYLRPLLEAVKRATPPKDPLTAGQGTLPELTARVESSVLLVICQ